MLAQSIPPARTTAEGHGHEGEARLERVVVQDLLQVEGEEEPHREQRRVHQHDDQVRRPQGPQPEDRDGDQRDAGEACLDEHEQRQQDGARRERDEDLRRAQPERLAADNAERHADEPDGDEQSPGDVEVAVDVLPAPFDEDPRAQDDDRGAHGHVDQEDRGPSEHLREQAAEQGPGRGAEPAHRRPGAEPAIALCALGQ